MLRVNTDLIELTDSHVYLLDGKPFTGVGYEANDDGTIISEMEFHNGIQHGTTRGYYSTGQIKRETQFECNIRHGLARTWDEVGDLVSEDEYENGVCIRRKLRVPSGHLSVCYQLDESDPQFEMLQRLRNAKYSAPSN
jgi:hypothetical protein